MFQRIRRGKRRKRRRRKPTISKYDTQSCNFAALPANLKPPVIPWNRFSNYNKLLRVFAYILRLLPNHSVFRQTSEISHPEDYLAAGKRIFTLSQKESFAEDLKHLRRNRNLSRCCRIIKFNPFLGSDNLL